jgi:hypothetical protein
MLHIVKLCSMRPLPRLVIETMEIFLMQPRLITNTVLVPFFLRTRTTFKGIVSRDEYFFKVYNNK